MKMTGAGRQSGGRALVCTTDDKGSDESSGGGAVERDLSEESMGLEE